MNSKITEQHRSRPAFVPLGGRANGADWKRSPGTDADGRCEFRYQLEDRATTHRFIALRYVKKPKPSEGNEPEQYQPFDTPEYSYRVFVTNTKDPVEPLVWFYNQRTGAENLIKDANNDAGLAAHPSGRWTMNCSHFQFVSAGIKRPHFCRF
jgi:hypothetical protein